MIAVVVPFVLVWIVDGGRGLKQTWPAALVAGLAFGIAQFVCSNYISVPLSDIVASLVGAAALVALVQVWKPSEVMETHPVLEAASAGAGIVNDSPHDSDRDRVIAFMPYMLIVAVFVIAQIPVVAGWLNVGLVKFAWPGLAIHTAAGKVANTTLAMPLISGAASLLLIAGILAAPILRVSAGDAIRVYGQTLYQMRLFVPTVFAVLAVAFVMNFSGQAATLGTWLASAGQAFAFFLRRHRLGRRGDHRVRQFLQRAVRRLAGGGREGDRLVSRSARGGEQFGRRPRQDDLAAEPRDRRGCRRNYRARG